MQLQNLENFIFFIYQFLKNYLLWSSATIVMLLIANIFSGFMEGLEGKEERSIPACVVLAIRKQFPEADGNYTGFKDPSITELDLAFFE